jgi:hypothetical protein
MAVQREGADEGDHVGGNERYSSNSCRTSS